MRADNYFRRSLRGYFTAAKDPNIRHGGSGIIVSLKRILYGRNLTLPDVSHAESLILNQYKHISYSELLESTYLLSRITREFGGIIQPRVAEILLERCERGLEELSRQDLIRLVQICSIMINRNKLADGDVASSTLVPLRSRLVQQCLSSLQDRYEDMSAASVSLLISSLARMYEPELNDSFHDLGVEVARRLNLCSGSDISRPASLLVLSDVDKLMSYTCLAFAQAELRTPKEFNDSCLRFVNNCKDHIPYSGLCQFISAFPRCIPPSSMSHPTLQDVLRYMERIAISADTRADLTLMDMIRLIHGASLLSEDAHKRLVNLLLSETIQRPSREFTIHVLRDLAILLGNSKGVDDAVAQRFNAELILHAREIPSQYIMQILESLMANRLLTCRVLESYLNKVVLPNMRRIAKHDLLTISRMTFPVSKKLQSKIAGSCQFHIQKKGS